VNVYKYNTIIHLSEVTVPVTWVSGI